MYEELVIAGSGGQGILLAGTLVALAAMYEEKETTWFPSYGPLMRTGEATCTVIISSEAIGSPMSEHPDSLIVMHNSSLKFIQSVKPGGLLIINKSLVGWDRDRTDLEVLEIKATDIAQALGSPQVANLVMLGAYFKKKRMLSFENLIKALKHEAVERAWKESSVNLNEKALYLSFNEVN